MAAIFRLALKDPPIVGAKVTAMVQLLPGVMLGPQVFVCVNEFVFVPPKIKPDMNKAEVPVFVSVTGWLALLVPTFCDPNVSVAGLMTPTGSTHATPTLVTLPETVPLPLETEHVSPVGVDLTVTAYGLL